MSWDAAVVLGLLLLASTSLSAAAQDRPLVQPSRDVAVTYRVEGAAASVVPGGIPGTLRLSWDAAGQRLRAEPEGRTQAVIVNLREHSAQVMDSMLRSALTLPVRDGDLQPLTLDGARLTQRGTDTVAGLPCTTWAVQAPRGAGTVCFTADGVALRADGQVDGQHGTFTASSVSYGPQPDTLFRVPAEYLQLSIPKFGRVK